MTQADGRPRGVVVVAADTWAYADRARSVAPVAAIEVRDGDHALLRRTRLWHHIAAEFARASLALPVNDATLARTFISAAAAPRAVL
jgi:hypothetical protein